MIDPASLSPDIAAGLTRAARFVVAPEGVMAAVALILAAAVLIYAMLLARLVPAIREVRRAARALSPFDTPEALAGGLGEIDAAMARLPGVRAAWRTYAATLVPAEGRMRTVRPAADVFHPGALLRGRVNLRFYNAVPGFLTGAGILGTFVGLAAGIHLANAGLTSADIFEVKQALSNLLGGASIAFLTSIAGLGSSILFSTREKALLHRYQAAVQRLAAEIERRVERVMPEQIEHRRLVEAERQTALLQSLRDGMTGLRGDLADADRRLLETLTDRLVGAVAGTVGEQVAAMARTIGALNETVSAQQETVRQHRDSLAEVANEARSLFDGSIRGAAEEARQALRTSLDEGRVAAAEASAALVQTVEASGRSVEKRLSTALIEAEKTLRSMLEAQRAALQELDDAMRAGITESAAVAREALRETLAEAGLKLQAGLAAANESLSANVSEAGRTFSERIAAAGEAMGASLAAAGTGVNDSLGTVRATLTETVAAITTASADTLAASRAALTETIGAVSAAATKSASEAGQLLRDSLDSARAAVTESHALIQEGARRSVAELEKGLRTALAEASTVAARNAETMAAAQALVSEMRRCQREIAAAATGFGATAEALSGTAGALRDGGAAIAPSLAALESALGRIEAMQSQLAAGWSAQEDRLQAFGAAADMLFREVREGLMSHAEQLNRYVADLDHHAAQVTEDLASAVVTLRDSLDGFTDELRQVKA